MSLVPQIPRDPLKLLENDGTKPVPVISKYYAPVVGGVIGFISVVLGNYTTKRPVFSGLQNHAVVTVGLAYFCKVMDDYRNKYMADRDAVLRHYVELHPEDFQPPEPKKLKDVLEPWYPLR